MERIQIADPAGREPTSTPDGVEVRARPRGLGDVRLGVLDNGKPNAAACLGALAESLHRRHETSYVALSKAVSSQPCPDDLLVRFRGFDAAIVGVGD